MKIGEAIATLDELKANTYTRSNKIAWLSRLDRMVTEQVLRHYVGNEEFKFDGYNDDTDPENELLMPEPFAEAYIRYMAAQIDLHNADYEDYNNVIELFNEMYQDYKNWYNSNHTAVIATKYLH
jgi:hypothetical protein